MTEPTELPILFEGSMVVANLAGLKTQTRRHKGLNAVNDCPDDWELVTVDAHGEPCSRHFGKFGALFRNKRSGGELFIRSPYGEPGGKLWVRETWQHENAPFGPPNANCAIFYRADYLDDPHGPDGELSPEGRYRTWQPSIHMPYFACRTWLDNKAVRLHRLQDINDADAIAEGTPGGHGAIPGYPYAATPVEHYRWKWEQLYGKGSWSHNIWVWVIDYAIAEETAREA